MRQCRATPHEAIDLYTRAQLLDRQSQSTYGTAPPTRPHNGPQHASPPPLNPHRSAYLRDEADLVAVDPLRLDDLLDDVRPQSLLLLVHLANLTLQ